MTNIRKPITDLLWLAALYLVFAGVVKAVDRPNILWLFQEDTSPWMGCYGDRVNAGWTPRIDKMAENGVRFSRAFVSAPVCSACRSGMMLGANAIRFGAHEHRSRRGEAKLPLPEGFKTIPELMREAGYFAFNVGKTDYNFAEAGHGIYSAISAKNTKTPWRECPKGQPFFGQIQLKGGKSNTSRNFPAHLKTDRSVVTVPADYPQNDLYRDVVAQHYDTIRLEDGVIGAILDRLKADGMSDSTIVVYFSDHGANHLVRHKQMPTEGGLHVPFIIQGPKRWVPTPGTVRHDLISTLDLLTGRASLLRDGLALDSAKNQGALAIRLRCTDRTRLGFSANGKNLGQSHVDKGSDFSEHRIALKPDVWNGTIKALKIDIEAQEGSRVEIDWIQVED